MQLTVFGFMEVNFGFVSIATHHHLQILNFKYCLHDFEKLSFITRVKNGFPILVYFGPGFEHESKISNFAPI